MGWGQRMGGKKMRAAWLVTCVLAAWSAMGQEAEAAKAPPVAQEEEAKALPRQCEKVQLGMLQEKLFKVMPDLAIVSASPMSEAIGYDVYRCYDKGANWEWSVGCYKERVIWFSLTRDLPRDSEARAQDLFEANCKGMWDAGKWTLDKRGNGYARDEETIISFFVVDMRRQAKKFRVMVTDWKEDREMLKAARAYREMQRRQEQG